jgi:predicted RNase H-like nuclease (RuvC/YqgF family)
MVDTITMNKISKTIEILYDEIKKFKAEIAELKARWEELENYFSECKCIACRQFRYKMQELSSGCEVLNGKSEQRPKLGIKISDFKIDMQDGKCVGNSLDEILFAMEEQEMTVPAELMELKQWLRFKGNSARENGDASMWDINTIPKPKRKGMK